MAFFVVDLEVEGVPNRSEAVIVYVSYRQGAIHLADEVDSLRRKDQDRG